jgi:hypothetical protein
MPYRDGDLAPDQRGDDTHSLMFRFARVSLKTGVTTYDGQRFAGRSLFLEALAQWNRRGLGSKDGPLWGYYEVREP